MPGSPAETLVAIVDDHPAVREAVTMTLESVGFGVLAFGSGEEFIEAVPDLDLQCVLLDVRLPALSGFDVLDELGGAACRFPVILITASGDPAFPLQASQAGARGWIRKPFDAERVLLAVRTALRTTEPT